MKIKIIITSAALFGILFFYGCKSQKDNTINTAQESTFNPVKDLQEKWILEWMKDVSVDDKHFSADLYPYFEFYPNQDSVVGHTGCNAFFGTIAVSEPNNVTFSDMIMTRKLCPNVEENKYVHLVNQVNKYAREAKQLELYQDTILLLRYKIAH